MPRGQLPPPPETSDPAQPVGGPPLDPAVLEHFLRALAEYGIVKWAAEQADVSRVTIYRYYKNDPEFAARFDEAKRVGALGMEDEARRRAAQGIEEAVYYQGEEVGKHRKFSDLLLIFLLKGLFPEKYRDRTELTGKDGQPLLPEPLDLRQLTTEELRQFRELAEKAARHPDPVPRLIPSTTSPGELVAESLQTRPEVV